MKMDRDINADGGGKYALINMRKLRALREQFKQNGQVLNEVQVHTVIQMLIKEGVLNLGNKYSENEFFPIFLKDTNAHSAIRAYSVEARRTDPEWADEVAEMLQRAGPNHPQCKIPD